MIITGHFRIHVAEIAEKREIKPLCNGMTANSFLKSSKPIRYAVEAEDVLEKVAARSSSALFGDLCVQCRKALLQKVQQ